MFISSVRGARTLVCAAVLAFPAQPLSAERGRVAIHNPSLFHRWTLRLGGLDGELRVPEDLSLVHACPAPDGWKQTVPSGPEVRLQAGCCLILELKHRPGKTISAMFGLREDHAGELDGGGARLSCTLEPGSAPELELDPGSEPFALMELDPEDVPRGLDNNPVTKLYELRGTNPPGLEGWRQVTQVDVEADVEDEGDPGLAAGAAPGSDPASGAGTA